MFYAFQKCGRDTVRAMPFWDFNSTVFIRGLYFEDYISRNLFQKLHIILTSTRIERNTVIEQWHLGLRKNEKEEKISPKKADSKNENKDKDKDPDECGKDRIHGTPPVIACSIHFLLF